MGEYMALLTQVRSYVNSGSAAMARDVLRKLLNDLNAEFVSTRDPAQKEKLRRSITRLLPVLDDLKMGYLSAASAAVIGVDPNALNAARSAAAPALVIPPRPDLGDERPRAATPLNTPRIPDVPREAPIAPAVPAAPKQKPVGMGRATNAMIPLTFDDYIGQEKAKRALKLSIGASKKTGRPLAHTLICSPYGLGKTTLANIIANQMGVPFFNVNATNLKDVKSLSLYFAKIDQSCIIFIDEIHSLKKDVQTVLLSIMTDFAVSYLNEAGESVHVDLPVFTLIGATTQAGELLKPFLNRFAVIELEDYTEEEKMILVRAKLDKLGYSATELAIADIARRCRGVPRTIETFVRGVIDIALMMDEKTITEAMTAEYFDMHEIDGLGLNKNDRRILSILDEEARPLALVTMESKTGIQREDLEFRYEPYLIKLGLLEKTERGRVITQKGSEYLHPKDDDDAAPVDDGALVEEPVADGAEDTAPVTEPVEPASEPANEPDAAPAPADGGDEDGENA